MLKLLKLWNTYDVPNQPKTKIRGFRIPDETYEAAQKKAEAEGRSVSDVVRELLERWLSPKEGASGV
jgi:predicted DNA-binding protein